MTVTGERVTTPAGGFNPTWQRHVAAYRLCARLLPPGRVLDLGCGIGHSYELLAPRETVGVDIDPEALAGQDRETHVADMRACRSRTRASTRCCRCSRSSTCPTPSGSSPRRGACSRRAASPCS